MFPVRQNCSTIRTSSPEPGRVSTMIPPSRPPANCQQPRLYPCRDTEAHRARRRDRLRVLLRLAIQLRRTNRRQRRRSEYRPASVKIGVSVSRTRSRPVLSRSFTTSIPASRRLLAGRTAKSAWSKSRTFSGRDGSANHRFCLGLPSRPSRGSRSACCATVQNRLYRHQVIHRTSSSSSTPWTAANRSFQPQSMPPWPSHSANLSHGTSAALTAACSRKPG
jgi:hypothetical protein